MKQNFVVFFSPGTIVAEQTEKPIDSWDVDKAVDMARSIKERHGTIPYGFQFTTRERKDDELDSKETERSGMHFLGGKILTVEDVEKQNDPDNAILISNMKNNGYEKVVENCNSWKTVQPLRANDVVVPFTASRLFSVSESYGPYPCEIDICGKEAWIIKLTAKENALLPEVDGGHEAIHYILNKRLGVVMCESCLSKKL